VVPLGQVIAAGQLTEIPGIGEAIADIITKMYRTGTHPSLEAMRKEIPAGVLEMLAVPGCDLTRCSSFIRHSVSPHSPISREDRVKGAKELGGALQAKILQSLAIAHSGAGRLHMHRAAF
jgi:DNA polymerase (family X)